MDESAAADIVISIRQQLEVLPAANPSFTIFRVPSHIRELNKIQYEPQIVSIGPYHYDHPSGRLRSMEQHKWRCLRNLLSQQPNTTLEDYVRATKALEGRARQCYAEHIHLPTHKFVEMLLLDACFILHFTIKWHSNDPDAMFDVEWSRPLIRSDLLMMENQIPFFILHSLFALLIPRSNSHTLINLISPCLMGNSKFKPPSINSSTQVCHLLHLYYSCCISTSIPPTSDPSEIHSTCNPFVQLCSCVGLIFSLLRSGVGLIFSLLHSCVGRLIVALLCSCVGRAPSLPRVPTTIPCATDLKNGGVKFMMIQSSGGSFLDVRFRKGIMEIPRLSVEKSTKTHLMNLVVYEQCNDPRGTKKLSSYVAFMDCLINTTDDIAVLEECGIIENMLSSREEAAHFFNQLSDCAHIDFKTHSLANLFTDVNHYYEKKSHKNRAILIHDYFSNPWTIISVVAAIILFILTFLQTFYAMFSYHHPPNK